jgi:hypothetical protein
MALDFDSIIKRTFAILGAQAIPFGIAALLLVGLPSYLLRGSFLDDAVLERGFSAGWSVSGLILMALQIVLTAIVMVASWQHLRGESSSLEATLRRGVQVLLSVWLTTLLLWSIFALGLIMLVIPYFIFRMILFVTLPAAVIEELGPAAALSRSAALTSGHRWALLGWTIVIWALGLVAGWALHLLLGIAGLGNLGGAVTAMLLAAFDAVAVTVIYADLRRARDGMAPGEIARIFN